MNIMVFDIPAELGGALTILKQYYDEAVQDTSNNWYFVISVPNLADTENVKVLKYQWIKKSWFHRLYFDIFKSHKLVEEYHIDKIISLQNIIVKGVKVKQTLYVHQPLPFIEKRYRISENFIYWCYQNLIGKMIVDSIRKADEVIVQTNWMKDACVKKIKISPSKFKVIQPKIKIEVNRKYKQEDENNKLFFYPASYSPYKNHKVIVEAANMLKKQGIENYKVVLTLRGNEDNNIKQLYDEVKKQKLPIEFVGEISLNEVYNYYSKSILIFPSYVETFGLPMLEARMHDSPILASDCAFSHEILDGYDKVKFFDPFKGKDLYQYMEEIVS